MSINFMKRYEEHSKTYIVAYVARSFTSKNVVDTATCCLLYSDATVITHSRVNDCINTCNSYFVDALDNPGIKEIQKRLIYRVIENSMDDRLEVKSAQQLEEVRSKIFDNLEDKAVFTYLELFDGVYQDRMKNVLDRANYNYDFENALEAAVPILRAYIVKQVHTLLA